MRNCAVLALLAVLFAGCATPDSTTHGLASEGQDASGRPVVIAVIDSGASPYYPIFRVSDDSFVQGRVPAPLKRVRFDLPTDEDPISRDEEKWESLEPNVLYHFEGTRLLGISVDHDRDARYHYVRDAGFHGVATTYFAAREAPEAIIVSVQVGMAPCLQDTSCLFNPNMATGMEWAANQDWIDIISVSLGVPANAPDRAELHSEMRRWLEASEKAAQSGKLVVNAAGNEAVPALVDYFNGPPWTILVGGVEYAARGEHVMSAKTVDIVANFTDWGPMYGYGDWAWRSGTSYATPIVAGTLAAALGEIRKTDPSRGTEGLRDALNATGVYFAPTEWDPAPPGREPLPDDVVNSASLPILLQPQMGWGYVDGSFAGEIARRVLENDLAPPAEKQQAIVFQAEWQKAREEYWARAR